MPFSNVEQLTPIMTEVVRLQPQRMLDVGCGLGVYGMLSRIQLDLYNDEDFYRKLFREHRTGETWQGVTIDAIEGFPDYLDYIPKWAYNHIRVEDVRTALPSIADASYDLCLALAIIEHLTKEEGIRFVQDLTRIASTVIIAVPKQVGPQEVPGNPFETHRSTWSQADFIALGAQRFLPHSRAWIPVFGATPPEASQPPLGAAAAPGTPPNATDLTPLLAQLEHLVAGQERLLQGQDRLLAAMSLKQRLRTYWRALTRRGPP